LKNNRALKPELYGNRDIIEENVKGKN